MTSGPISAASRNKSEARLRVVNEDGDLYAAQSADGVWVKIGFSTRLADRLKSLSRDFPKAGPFRLLGQTISNYHAELQLHRAMHPFHQIRIASGKELYPACPAVLFIVNRVIIGRDRFDGIELDDLLPFRRWCRSQAKLEQNAAVARVAHAEQIAKNEAAHERYMAWLSRRIAARNAARAA